jgi:hypothetical protein
MKQNIVTETVTSTDYRCEPAPALFVAFEQAPTLEPCEIAFAS